MSNPMLIPADCLAAISGTVNGRCSLFFSVPTKDALKFLALFVECYRAEHDAAEWPSYPDEGEADTERPR